MSVKFNSEEKYSLGLFVKAHSGKSWVVFKENDNKISMSAIITGKPTKKVEITKSSDTGFDVEITSGVYVLCHIHWNGSLTQLLMRMEAELFDPALSEPMRKNTFGA